MRPLTYVTTSWDDGHPSDLRVADLLAKHGVSGTFYVPLRAEGETLSTPQLRHLSGGFEIGAHTLHHVVLTRTSDQKAWQEISGSKAWVEDITGQPCPMFCPPRGKFAARHLRMARDAGFVGLRSVEMLSLDFPRPAPGLVLMPTTVQTYPHGFPTLAVNAIKPGAFGNLWRLIAHSRALDWPKLACSLLHECLSRGGVFHLWGHSWEIEEREQWQRLDEVLRVMGQFVCETDFIANGELCRRPTPAAAHGKVSKAIAFNLN